MQRQVLAIIAAMILCVCAACSPAANLSQNASRQNSDQSNTEVNVSVPLFSSSAPQSNADSTAESAPVSSDEQLPEVVPTKAREVRGMWIAFFELYPMFDGDFSAEFSKMLDKCVDSGINTVYVHVRSHCDAFYKSELFPWSGYCNKNGGVQGADPGFDPLKVMIDLAHARGLELHAWINPYRVAKDGIDLSKLADNNPAKIWLTDDNEENDRYVTECNGGLYLNPAEPEVQRLITDGVREIVENYDVDGIHFDDYFYPTTDASFDEAQYAAYRASVSSNPLPLADWRRANVNAMVSAVYNAVKSARRDCIFGISPMASIKNNYNTVFADCAKWLELGIVDYIMPQLYFGFEYTDKNSCFDTLLAEWRELFKGNSQQLYIGLGSYRVGSKSEGFTEWSERSDVLSRQIEMLRADGVSDGFVLYSCTTFFKDDQLSNTVREETVKTIVKTSGE